MASILLIDDDVDLVEGYKAVLAQRKHNVRTAYNAAEARKALKEERPDVIVLDVMMETESAGFDLAREINKNFPDLPTLMLSGIHELTGTPYRFEPDETWLPVVEFLDKPVSPADLAREIESILVRQPK